MLLNVFDGNVPAFDRVAGFTLGPHLSAMDVSVALSALVADVGEYQLYVALRTGHGGVHSTERVGGLVVIEVRDSADRLPTHAGMA